MVIHKGQSLDMSVRSRHKEQQMMLLLCSAGRKSPCNGLFISADGSFTSDRVRATWGFVIPGLWSMLVVKTCSRKLWGTQDSESDSESFTTQISNSLVSTILLQESSKGQDRCRSSQLHTVYIPHFCLLTLSVKKKMCVPMDAVHPCALLISCSTGVDNR